MSIKDWWFKIFSHKPEEYSPPVRFPAGTKITCPECGKEIAVAMRDIKAGELIRSDAWRSDVIKKMGRMVCPDDGASYIMPVAGGGKSVHTSKGWM